jgi:hypothetical protein
MMADFSISDTAFTGFRIVRERPTAVLTWAIIALILSLALTSLFVSIAGPTFMQLRALGPHTRLGPNDLMVLVGRLAPMYAILIACSLVFGALLFAAMNRAVFDPDDEAFGYFRLGADELRQLPLMAPAFVVAYVLMVLVLLLAAMIWAQANLGAHSGVSLIGVAVDVAAICGIAYLAVRLSLASALTFATGKVRLFGSWPITRGHFWPILGTYALAAVFAVVVYLLSYLIIFAVIAAVSGGEPFSEMANTDMSSIGAFFTRARLVQTILGAPVVALIWPLLGAPAPVIYRRLTVPAAAAD